MAAHRRPFLVSVSALLSGALLAALGLTATPAAASGRPAAGRAAIDWSVAVADSTMTRYTPATIGGWTYPVALYLYGQYLVYRRTHDPRYLAYVRSWMDRFVDAQGHVDQTFGDLNSMLAGRLLLVLYRETGDARYRTAATAIVDRLKTYPRTSDGGFWHATDAHHAHQLWDDGTFMVDPFLAEYGREFHSAGAQDEAARQLVIYASHLQQPNGLLRHAYDEARAQSWADPVTGVSPEFWCRADGWYGMAILTVLDTIPRDQAQRPRLLRILRNLAAGIKRYQDPATGRWFQVMDKGDRSDDWTETSCSSMFAYTLSRATREGYIAPSYTAVARKAYRGVLDRISVGSGGLTDLTGIVVGTGVGDYAYYVARAQATNDFHGLGAFLIMNEELRAPR